MTPLLERLPPDLTVEACAARLGSCPWFTWLDSGSDASGLGRWSLLCAEPWGALRAMGMRTERRRADGTWQAVEGDILAALDRPTTGYVTIAERTPAPPLESMFDDVYATAPWHLVEQRQQLLSGPRAPSSH